MTKLIHTQDVISVQSTGFWIVASNCLEHAYPIYRQNLQRPPIAGAENINASTAILVLIVSLESHLNRLMFFNPEGLTTDVPMLEKTRQYLPDNPELQTHLAEVTVCRDAVTHALMWQEKRVSESGRLVEHSTELAPITQLRNKVNEHVPNGTIRTRLLDVNVVPTNVDFLDAVKTLIIVTRVMRALEAKYGNPHAWVGHVPAEIVLQHTFPLSAGQDQPEDWIAALLRSLHSAHARDVRARFNIESLDGGDYFSGIT
jgi:hypothetical protein